MTKKERSDRSPRRRRKAAGRKGSFLRKALGLIRKLKEERKKDRKHWLPFMAKAG